MWGTWMKWLVTGAAGFIGMHTAKRLLEQGHEVVGLDNLNHYYDVRLKHYRLEQLQPYPNFRFIKMDLADREGMAKLACRKIGMVLRRSTSYVENWTSKNRNHIERHIYSRGIL